MRVADRGCERPDVRQPDHPAIKPWTSASAINGGGATLKSYRATVQYDGLRGGAKRCVHAVGRRGEQPPDERKPGEGLGDHEVAAASRCDVLGSV